MKIREIIGALESVAPLSLQDSYDNAGLQLGLAEDVEASGALLCLDVTEDVIDEAISVGCNLIISHHPMLFRPLKCITGADYVQRCIIKAIKHDIAIYSAHTNLDCARGGVNFKIAEVLGLQYVEWLNPKQGVDAGEGIIGELPVEVTAHQFCERIKEKFHVESVRCNYSDKQTIKRVAVCGGAGAFLIPKAIEKGADVFLTGEIGFHRFFGHDDEILLLEIGHYESEQYTVPLLHKIISQHAPDLRIYETEQRTNPISYL